MLGWFRRRRDESPADHTQEAVSLSSSGGTTVQTAEGKLAAYMSQRADALLFSLYDAFKLGIAENVFLQPTAGLVPQQSLKVEWDKFVDLHDRIGRGLKEEMAQEFADTFEELRGLGPLFEQSFHSKVDVALLTMLGEVEERAKAQLAEALDQIRRRETLTRRLGSSYEPDMQEQVVGRKSDIRADRDPG